MRDQHGGSRAVAYLMLAGGAYNLVTGVLMKLGDPLYELITLGVASAALFAVGLICLRRPGTMPAVFWLLVPFVSAAVVTGLNVATADATLGPQLFYLWPLLYAASFLSRRLIVLIVAQISAGHALTAFRFEEPDQALLDWIAITVAMAMTAVVVVGLRERNDRLLRVLEHQATSDALTGAANRRAFDAALARAAATPDPLSLIVIDVDHFKTINDTWGHAVGDRALRAVADALHAAADSHVFQSRSTGDQDAAPSPTGGRDVSRRSAAGRVADRRSAAGRDAGRRSTDERDVLVARLGGDEFAVLLRAGPDAALRVAEQARISVSAVEGLPCGPPSLSIGVAAVPDHATGAEELQRVADSALYRSKAGGRGRSTLAGTDEPRHNVDDIPVTSPASSRSAG